MKLSIVELDYHWNVLNGLCEILAQSDWEIRVYTKASIAHKLKEQPYYNKTIQFVDKPFHQSKKAFS